MGGETRCHRTVTTSITEAEILYGIEVLKKGKRRDQMFAAAEAMFAEDFAGRILAFDSNAARNFARIAAARALGRPISHPDAQIAVIAKARGGNTRDAQYCGF